MSWRGCMPGWTLGSGGGAAPRAPVLQMHTVLDAPLTANARGRISCRPLGQEPIDFDWTGPEEGGVATDATGSEALDVRPGRYRVVAVDASGSRADVLLDVEPALPTALVVEEYRVTPASTSSSRDGSVEAVGVGLDDGKHTFLWTHGVETEAPLLRDVPCGVYACVALPTAAGDVPTLVHRCAPARVTVDVGSERWPLHAAAEAP